MALLAFIAPLVPEAISPRRSVFASIGLAEEFAIEVFLAPLEQQAPETRRLLLLIHSPGGSVVSSYKVARLLRDRFDCIRAYIPNMAASGGTLLALSADSLIMGPAAHITPIDTQVMYKGERVFCIGCSADPEACPLQVEAQTATQNYIIVY